MIHPTAIVEEGAALGAGVVLHAGAIVRRGAFLGDGVIVHPYAVIGGDPQDLRFDPATASGVRIGAGTVIREFATVHRSTRAGGCTVVGAKSFLMVASHVGHDCQVGDQVILANNVLLAGHVHVGEGSFVGGGAAIHQGCRVGESVMVGGLSRLTRDIAPFVMVAERDEVSGLNLVGLRRRGVAREAIRELKEAFRAVFWTAGNIRALAAAHLAQVQTPEARRFLEFFATGKRGFARTVRAATAMAGDESEAGA